MKELENSLTVRCNCGHAVLEFVEDHKYDDDIYIQYYYSEFYAKQRTILGIIWDRIKFALSILRGKEFYLYDIYLADQNKENFKKNLKEFIEKM